MKLRTGSRLRERLPLPARSADAEVRDVKSRLRERLMAPVDAASIALFRFAFGSILLWEAARYMETRTIVADFQLPRFLFTWWAFGWVKPLPGAWIYVPWALMALAAFLVAVGLFYRPAAVVLCAGIAYHFLLDQGVYLNHRYLAGLFVFLLIIVPAHSAFSLDALRKPWIRSQTVPTWGLWLLRSQVGLPYFYAGVAKLNFDWLVRGEPLREWLVGKTDFPIIGRFFTEEIAVRSMAYGATALDLFVPFLLLHRRTRTLAYGAALGFHFLNARLFNIGMFPWMMIVATTIFFDPDWPRRMVSALRSGPRLAQAAVIGGFLAGFATGAFLPETFSGVHAVVGGFGVAFLAFHLVPQRLGERGAEPPRSLANTAPWRRFVFSRPLAVFLAVWVAVQVLVPLRHFAYPGNVHWTEEGHRFAWHMLLRQKAGFVVFRVTDPLTGETWTEDLTRHINRRQSLKMAHSPTMMVTFAHYLESYYRELGRGDLQVRVDSTAWLNRRAHQRLIYPDVDLTEIRRPILLPASWIVPLEPYH